MTLRLLKRVLLLLLGLASVAGSALAATPGTIPIESRADILAVGDALTLTPTPTLTLTRTRNPSYSERFESESKSRSKSKSEKERTSKRKDPHRPPDSTPAAPGPVLDRLIDFQQYRFGVPPPDFDYETAGPLVAASASDRPSWRTYVDLSAPSPKMVLIHFPVQARAEDFPMAVLRDVTAENVNLAVSFKLLGGDTARSAGLLWRGQGTNGCRSVLVSALHREIRLLRMETGRITELAKATATFDQKDWNFLEVSVQGERVAVWLNERGVLEARDAEPAIPGRVGLITAGDTVALFDDFHVQNGQGRVARKTRPAPALPPAPVLHVTEILTTEADFKTPCRSFQPGAQLRWRVHVADEREKPRSAAIVECELVNPGGEVLGHDKAMTGTDGASLFTRALAADAAPGSYTVRVKLITHADMPEATYSSRASRKSAVPFEVRP